MTAPENPSSSAREMLRHAVATAAYRGAKALRDAPLNFPELTVSPKARTPRLILAHLCDLFDWALTMARGQSQWRPSEPSSWDDEARRFFRSLEAFDAYLGSEQPLHAPVERLFQGPVADALTHIGQLALLRGVAGSPLRGENYFVADITAGRAGPDQAPARREFD